MISRETLPALQDLVHPSREPLQFLAYPVEPYAYEREGRNRKLGIHVDQDVHLHALCRLLQHGLQESSAEPLHGHRVHLQVDLPFRGPYEVHSRLHGIAA